jgi:hypothetical protein
VLVTAVALWQVILAIHIAAVVVAFGVTFAYPLFAIAGARLDPRAMPWFHRMQQRIGRRLVSPGLGLVLVSGIYLAAKLHQWSKFYVQWGVAVVLVLGALQDGFVVRRQGRLAELAERDMAAAGDGPVTWSPEYETLRGQVGTAEGIISLLVLVTIYLMTVQS